LKAKPQQRRFVATDRIDFAVLHELIDLTKADTRLRNLQPLKYLPTTESSDRRALRADPLGFDAARYSSFGRGTPTAYIVVCIDTEIGANPPALARSGNRRPTMALAATDKGLGSCIIGNLIRIRCPSFLAAPQTSPPRWFSR
jgi:nitroreductase